MRHLIDLWDGASYYIAVKARNKSGESDYSNIEKFTIQAPKVSVFNKASIYEENGWLENIQVLVVALACLITFLSVVCQKREDKLLLVFFSLACLTFILREIDVEDLNIPYILKLIGSGVWRNVILTTGFLTVSLCMMFHVKHYKTIFKRLIMSKECVLVVTAGMLLCLGEVIEKSHFVPHHIFWEETSELVGYLLILLTAIKLNRQQSVAHPNG